MAPGLILGVHFSAAFPSVKRTRNGFNRELRRIRKWRSMRNFEPGRVSEVSRESESKNLILLRNTDRKSNFSGSYPPLSYPLMGGLSYPSLLSPSRGVGIGQREGVTRTEYESPWACDGWGAGLGRRFFYLIFFYDRP